MQNCLMCEEKCDSALVYYTHKMGKGSKTPTGPKVYPFHEKCFEEPAGIVFDPNKGCQLCPEELQDIFAIFRTDGGIPGIQGRFFYFHKKCIENLLGSDFLNNPPRLIFDKHL